MQEINGEMLLTDGSGRGGEVEDNSLFEQVPQLYPHTDHSQQQATQLKQQPPLSLGLADAEGDEEEDVWVQMQADDDKNVEEEEEEKGSAEREENDKQVEIVKEQPKVQEFTFPTLCDAVDQMRHGNFLPICLLREMRPDIDFYQLDGKGYNIIHYAVCFGNIQVDVS